MILLFGTRAMLAIINVVTFVCGYCGVHADQRVTMRSTRLTLFFVPLFPLSRSYFNECSNCGAITPLSSAQARHSLEWARSHQAGS
jgi:hypothetical protein